VSHHASLSERKPAPACFTAGQPIELGYVPGLEPLDHPGEFGPIATRTAHLLGKYPGTSRSLQLGDLAGEVLLATADTGISEVHKVTVFSQRYMRQ
jgi:hypothetical protein